MNNQLLRNCGIQPELLARFKEIFPEHADIEEFINTLATRNDNGPRHDSSSIADRNHTASLEQAQIREALATSLFEAQILPVPSNNAPVSAQPISHSRNLSSHGSRNNSTNSELAAAIALSLETLIAESTVPAAESQGQGVPSTASSLPEAVQENVDPDNMTYEELQDLGDSLGTESRGLPEELIANFPTQKLSDKSGWFSSQKNKPEECSICIEEYKTGDELLTLPCLHLYHKPCITQWLTHSKTCPVCNMDCSAPPQS
ncbi:unnamed protein product [Rhodiola kirilowii]